MRARGSVIRRGLYLEISQQTGEINGGINRLFVGPKMDRVRGTLRTLQHGAFREHGFCHELTEEGTHFVASVAVFAVVGAHLVDNYSRTVNADAAFLLKTHDGAQGSFGARHGEARRFSDREGAVVTGLLVSRVGLPTRAFQEELPASSAKARSFELAIREATSGMVSSTARPVLASPWGSRSITSVESPLCNAADASPKVMDVLPTPPLRLLILTMRGMQVPFMSEV